MLRAGRLVFWNRMKSEKRKTKIFFELKLKYTKISFSIPNLKWNLNGTFSARGFYVLSLNFSIETKIKTLFLISYFNYQKRRNGALGTQSMIQLTFTTFNPFHVNASVYFNTFEYSAAFVFICMCICICCISMLSGTLPENIEVSKNIGMNRAEKWLTLYR